MTSSFGSIPAEADAIRTTAEQLLSSTRKTRSVADDWNAAGLRTRRGHAWTNASARKVLRGTAARAILGDRVHDALQVRLRQSGPRPGGPMRHLNVGICGTCGAGMYVDTPTAGPKRMVCAARHRGYAPKDEQRHPQINEHFVLDRVRDGVINVIRRHGARLLDYEPLPLTMIATRIGDLETQRRGVDHDASMVAIVRRIDSEIEVLKGEHEDRLLFDVVAGLKDTSLNGIGQWWDGLSTEQQRNVANRLLYVEVGLGRGASRVRVESLLDA